MPLAGLSDAYRAALGKFVAVGYNSKPTLYDTANTVYTSGSGAFLTLDYPTLTATFGSVIGGNGWAIQTYGLSPDASHTMYASLGANAPTNAGGDGTAAFLMNSSDFTGEVYFTYNATTSQIAAIAQGLQTTFLLDLQDSSGDHLLTVGPDATTVLKAAPGQDDIQTVTQTGSATGGTYTLASASPAVSAGPINYNGNNAHVQGVFDTAFGAGKTTITGNAASFTVEFIGTLANQLVNLLTLSDNSLTGGTSPTVTITHTTYGRAAPTTLFDVQTSAGAHILQVQPTKIGFFGVTPVVQRSAYTQTYSTASRTVPALTSAAVVTTAAALASYGYTEAQANAIVTAINALRTDVSNIAQVCNSLIDDSQALGFAT